MNGNTQERELKERIELIESMLAEGRMTTEHWGWVFVLWGVAYYVAIAWSQWGHSALAWPVTMLAAFVLTRVWSQRNRGKGAATTMGRALISIWISGGISMLLLFMSLGITHKLTDVHVFVAGLAAMLGMINAASSMILKWKMQFACAVVWWAATLVGCFGSADQAWVAFLVAIFLCQIVFGIYGTLNESRRQRLGESHV